MCDHKYILHFIESEHDRYAHFSSFDDAIDFFGMINNSRDCQMMGLYKNVASLGED